MGLKWIVKSYETIDDIIDFLNSTPFKICTKINDDGEEILDIDYKNNPFYKAVHVTVAYKYSPKVYDRALHNLEMNESDFIEYIEKMRPDAEDEIKLEVIICTKPYFVISEIGLSQHEEMIIEKSKKRTVLFSGNRNRR